MPTDLPSGFLTNKQRDVILGECEYDNPRSESKQKDRIIEYVYNGLRFDGSILAYMSPEQRRKVFRYWEEVNYKRKTSAQKTPKPATERDGFSMQVESDDWWEKEQLRLSVQGLLQFVYQGVDEGNVGDFWDILWDAIDMAARERGQYVKTFEPPTIEYGELMNVGDLARRLANGTLGFDELTKGEMDALLTAGIFDDEDTIAELEEKREEYLAIVRKEMASIDEWEKKRVKERKAADNYKRYKRYKRERESER